MDTSIVDAEASFASGVGDDSRLDNSTLIDGGDSVTDSGSTAAETLPSNREDGSESLITASSEVEEEEIKDEKYLCPAHRNMIKSLRSSTVLSPLHVSVRNLSYWYAQRKCLGPKRHNALPIRQNTISGKWESVIFKMKPNEEDGTKVPTKSQVSSHSTKISAFKRSEQACRERDASPVDNEKIRDFVDVETLQATHFRILVVSAAFDRLNSVERAVLIYEALINGMGNHLIPDFKGLGQCPPLKMKIASTFGQNTCQLPIFQFLLPNQPLQLIVEARTPSQWKPKLYAAPDSERYGRSHLGFTSLEIPLPLLPNAHKTRAQKLTIDLENVKLPHIDATKKPKYYQNHGILPPTIRKVDLNSLNNSLENLSVVESLGMEASVAGLEYKRLGGIYGHFLRDMPREVRAKVMDKIKDGKLLIQREGNRDPAEIEAEKAKRREKKNSFQPKTGLSMMREKMEAKKNLCEYDKGTQTEKEMMEEIYMAAKRLERWAIRIQRLRRINITVRAVKLIWKRHFAAIIIQKAVRGHYGRLYAKLLAKMIPKAVARIQKAYFLYKSWFIVKEWQFLFTRMSKRIIPRMKTFIFNIVRNWFRLRNAMAIRIQSLVRMFIMRARYHRKLGEIYFLGNFLYDSAVQIQRVYRGILGRRRHKYLYEFVLRKKVDEKAAIRIQRVARGIQGRKISARKALERISANIIQRNVRRFVRHCWEAQMRYVKLLNFSATQIQKIVRAKIDREIFRRAKWKWFYNHVFIPAVIRLQSIARRHTCMKKYKILKVKWQACTTVQRAFRLYKRRCEALARWQEAQQRMKNNLAIVIQKNVRRMIARIRFEEMKLAYDGKVVLAAKRIIRAWVSYKQYKRFQFLLDDHRIMLFKKRILKLSAARQDLYLDIKEIQDDIENVNKVLNRYKNRLKDVKLFTLQAAARLPVISKEMAEMSAADFERGWAEAFGSEFESLTSQNNMATEEIRLLKSQIMKRERELLNCNLELEEAHIELDSICVLEIEAYEGLRRAELQKINRRVKEKWDRLIRQEKMRWKSDSTRYNVILRKRPAFKSMMEKAMAPHKLGARDMAYAQTIEYEKRAKVWDKEEILRENLIKEDGLINSTSYKGYEKYIEPIVNTYDAVVSNTKQLLRGFALDDAANRIKNQYQYHEKLKKKLKGGQFAPLKDEFVSDQKLSFKEALKEELSKKKS